jgi:hypothetical protein
VARGRRSRMKIRTPYSPLALFARQRDDAPPKNSRRLPSLWGALASYRQVHVIEATSGASGVTMRGFGMFKEFGGAVHGSTHTPSSSMS